MNTRVKPQIGYFEVATVDRWGIQSHQVGMDKRCTRGGPPAYLLKASWL